MCNGRLSLKWLSVRIRLSQDSDRRYRRRKGVRCYAIRAHYCPNGSPPGTYPSREGEKHLKRALARSKRFARELLDRRESPCSRESDDELPIDLCAID